MLITDHIRAAAAVAKVDPADLMGRCRRRMMVGPRMALVLALRERRCMAKAEIGRHLGWTQDTIRALVNRAEALRATDERFDALCRRVAEAIPQKVKS